jgi:hypothetical protein
MEQPEEGSEEHRKRREKTGEPRRRAEEARDGLGIWRGQPGSQEYPGRARGQPGRGRSRQGGALEEGEVRGAQEQSRRSQDAFWDGQGIWCRRPGRQEESGIARGARETKRSQGGDQARPRRATMTPGCVPGLSWIGHSEILWTAPVTSSGLLTSRLAPRDTVVVVVAVVVVGVRVRVRVRVLVLAVALDGLCVVPFVRSPLVCMYVS